MGDYLLTTTNKLISIEREYANPYKSYIVQYNYSTGVTELDIDISAIFTNPWVGGGIGNYAYGLFEHNGDIFIAAEVYDGATRTGAIFKIDRTTPYAITLFDTTSFAIYGASQLNYRITSHFII